MLLDFRDGIRNSKWLKYILVGIICVPFVFFGVSSYFGNHGPDYAAKVNGQKVSYNAFQSAAQQSQIQLRQTLGGQLPPGVDLGSIVNNQAMETVIRQEVLRQSTEGKGFAVGDEDLAQQILSVDAFNVEGVFNKERYSGFLQSRGMSAAEFEEQYRSDLLMQQFRNSVVGSGFALGDESKALEALRTQQRQASFIKFGTQAKADSIEVSDDEVQAHYNENLASFNNPEKVKLEYLELRVEDLMESVEVTDGDLEGYFEQNKTQWVVEEKRDASHILLAVDSDASNSETEKKLAEAEALVTRINAGESIASLASEFSDDPGSADNGGSLGEFGRGVMLTEFEEAVYSMEIGDVSAPVKTDFGYHIIQLDNIIAEQGQTFDEVKDEVDQQYRAQVAETRFFEASDKLSNASYENNDSLQPAADETELELKTSEWIDRNSAEGIGAFPQVLAAALTDDVKNNGLNSDVLSVGENHAIVVRTIEYEDAAPKPFDEVREDAAKRVQTEKATEELTTLADSLVAELKGGADAAALATEHEGEFTETAAIARDNTETDRTLIRELFTMPKPAGESVSYRRATDSNGDIVVIAFSGIETAADEAATESVESTGSSVAAIAEYDALVNAIEGDADIERNDALLAPADYQ